MADAALWEIKWTLFDFEILMMELEYGKETGNFLGELFLSILVFR